MPKNLIWGPVLACSAQIWAPQFFFQFLPLLVVRHCSKLSSYAIYRKTNETNLRKWQKANFGPDFDLLWPKFGPQKSFSWVLPLLDVNH